MFFFINEISYSFKKNIEWDKAKREMDLVSKQTEQVKAVTLSSSTEQLFKLIFCAVTQSFVYNLMKLRQIYEIKYFVGFHLRHDEYKNSHNNRE